MKPSEIFETPEASGFSAVKSEGAEWEDELYDLMADKHYCSDIAMQACQKVGHLAVKENELIAFVTHQRQQAREEGYNAGLADGTKQPLLAIEQARHQAVAEFAREVVNVPLELRSERFIEGLLKQRGITL